MRRCADCEHSFMVGEQYMCGRRRNKKVTLRGAWEDYFYPAEEQAMAARAAREVDADYCCKHFRGSTMFLDLGEGADD